MTSGALLQALTQIGHQLSDSGAAQLAGAVDAAGTPETLRLKADALPTPPQQKLAGVLADVWEAEGELGADALALGLRAAQAGAEAERLGESIDLVWTGPKTSEVAVLRNDEALFEVIDFAQGTLLIVSAFTWGLPEVVEKLGEAVARGVEVRLVLEWHDKKGQPTGFDPVKDLGGDLDDAIEIYQWPPEVREVDPKSGKMGYLHVKCAVADSVRAFVSSANLTTYAMEWNMELGVAIDGGPVPPQIASHFAALIDEGTLQRV
jgi:cardiolipin synthase A/B